MSNEEIRKLLGGYATNTLSEAERKALFEASLEDQELFDALNQEQALKDLLADPVSRAQIRQALEKPLAAWWSRWWAWSGVAGAIAAAVLIVAVTRSHAPEPARQIASFEVSRAPAPPLADKKVESDSELKQKAVNSPARVARDSKALALTRDMRAHAGGVAGAARSERPAGARNDELQPRARPAAVAPTEPTEPPPPPASTAQQAQTIPAPAQAPAAVPAPSRGGDTQSLSQQSQRQMAVNSVREQEQQSPARLAQSRAVIGGALFKANLTPVSYTLLKRDESGAYQPLAPDAGLQTGDAVRLTVAPTISGYLSLSRQDASGEWLRVFPESGPGLSVSANSNYIVPDSPIGVTDAAQKLRLTLLPWSKATGAGSGDQVKAKAAPLKKESVPNTPLVVEITIGPRKAP